MQIEIQPPNQPNRFEALSYAYFAPELPQLEAAIGCIAPNLVIDGRLDQALEKLDHTPLHPRKAWELLAARGIIPTHWVDAPHRWFQWHQTHFDPLALSQAATLASNVSLVMTAEALAWEMASRLQPFGLPTPKRVFYRQSREQGTGAASEHPQGRNGERGDTAARQAQKRKGPARGEEQQEKTPRPHEPWLGFYQMLFEARVHAKTSPSQERDLDHATLNYMHAINSFAGERPKLRDPLFLAHLEDLWEIATRHGWLICNSPALFLDGNRFLPDLVVGRPFSDFSNPFSPLVALYRLGFGCAGFMRACLVLLSR